MTGLEVRQLSELYLLLLRRELARRGVTCDLADIGGQARLSVYCPGAAPAAQEPLDIVSLAFIDGQWWCCWPEAMVICPVTPLTRAAQAIISELGLGQDDPGPGGNVVRMAAWSRLRQARLSIARPPIPNPRPGAADAMISHIHLNRRSPLSSPHDPLDPRDPQFQASTEASRLLRLSRHAVFHMICNGEVPSAPPGWARRVVEKTLLRIVGHRSNGSTHNPPA